MSVIDEFGSDPTIIKWNVTRGDTSKIKIEFLNNDEVTKFSTSGWEYLSTAYDPKTDIADELEVSSGPGYVIVTAPSDVTENWGTAYNATVAELLFDVQITGPDFVWTPIVGTISVIGDVSGSL
jgi:hypothetical protein